MAKVTYTAEEQQMVDEFRKVGAEEFSGWGKALAFREASAESIKRWAYGVDPYNPLFSDEQYGEKTGWGSMIGAPFFVDNVGNVYFALVVPKSMKKLSSYWYSGCDWEFFKPVFPGDKFRMWCRPPQIIDATTDAYAAKGIHQMVSIPHDADYYNQKNELQCSYKLYLEYEFNLKEPANYNEKLPAYKYTKDEIAFIESMEKGEEIRGSKMRYWEYVNVGDKLTPVSHGPTTFLDHTRFMISGHGASVPPMRIQRHSRHTTYDKDRNIAYDPIEDHLNEAVAQLHGNPHAFHFGCIARQEMARCVSNWMGDDGFIRKMKWRHIVRTPVGDTIFGHGVVTKKYMEGTEPMVDLDVWTENIRGNITEVAKVTVRLYSRKGPLILY
jgi:acyl dehydratase